MESIAAFARRSPDIRQFCASDGSASPNLSVALYVYPGALGQAVIVGEAIGTLRWLLLLLGLAATLVAIFYIARKAQAELAKAALDRV